MGHDSAVLGTLKDATALLDDPLALRRHFAENGYALLRGVLDADAVRAARSEVLAALVAVDEIVAVAEPAVATGRSRRVELHANPGAFWKSVSEGPALRRVTNGAALAAVAGKLLGAQSVGHDYLFLRATPPGRASRLHFDFPFMNRGTDRVITCWMPLGEVPTTLGPLAIVEGSQAFEDLLGPIRARAPLQSITSDDDPVAFARSRGTHLLSADFHAGDLIVFGMTTMHCSLDNVSTDGHVRISCDIRYQPADAERDARYFGPDPAGFAGGGYGELNSAKPLTAEWHVR
jgi:ectoine hydroxylase-related dioxygenase (phytanoyl-CoA dioxygenase family)